MAEWVTDHQIHMATNNEMRTSFNTMFDHTPSAASDRALNATQSHWNCVLALDPSKIRTEYERLFEAAVNIGDNEKAIAKIRLTDTHLVRWTGDAANAFKEQLTMMELFCTNQKTRILEGLRGVAAVYAVAVEGRQSYLAILQAATAAAMNVHHQNTAKDTEAKVTVIANVVSGVITRDPNSLRKSVVDTLFDVGKDLVPRFFDDSGADQVCDSYFREAELLCQSLGRALDDITRSFREHRDSASDPPELFKPLPGYCDVRSPDFTYARFNNTIHDPGPIGLEVEAERRKYAEEKPASSGEIDRRLNHGDKGAI